MAAKPWTDAEKLGLLLQIVEKAGPVPWDSLELPEGRTKKACMVLIDREKQAIKKAREAKGIAGEAKTPASGKKRAAQDANDNETPAKKAKSSKSKKGTQVKVEEDALKTGEAEA